jgi:hypothetical protein
MLDIEMKLSKGDLLDYKGVDPDTIYHPGSWTFLFTESGHLYMKPHPIAHRDLLQQDEIFADIYPGRKVNAKQRSQLSSRGQVLEFTKTIVGRIGALGDTLIMALWNENVDQQLFGKFLSVLFKEYPSFQQIVDRMIVVTPKWTKLLSDIIGSKPVKRAVSLKGKKKTLADTPNVSADTKFDIGGKGYTLHDLQQLRAAIHTKTPIPGVGDPYAVLCHPDLAKYPVLVGYRPATCGEESPLRPSHPSMWRQAGQQTGLPYLNRYGEGFSEWFTLQDIFDKR